MRCSAVAVEEDAEKKAEAELQTDLLARASAARARAQAIKAISFQRKHSRRKRSLLFRGLVHVAFTLLLAVSICPNLMNNAYDTQKAVRDALNAPFSSVPGLYGDTNTTVTCAQRQDATFMAERRDELLRMSDSRLGAEEVLRLQEVHATPLPTFARQHMRPLLRGSAVHRTRALAVRAGGACFALRPAADTEVY